MHIVIVEKSTTDCRVVRNRLIQIGCEDAVAFIDTEAALTHIRRQGATCVITRKNLKNTSGCRLARDIRKSFSSSELPILMIATHYTHEDMLEGTENGIDHFLLLPFTSRALRKKIDDMVSKKNDPDYRDLRLL